MDHDSSIGTAMYDLDTVELECQGGKSEDQSDHHAVYILAGAHEVLR